MKVLSYNRPNKITLLHDQLLAAGITPLVVENAPDGSAVITIANAAQEAAVDAVVSAHVPTALSVAEALDQERTTASGDLDSQYTAALTRLDEIIANGATYNANQTRDAVIDEARIQRRLMRFTRQLS